MGGLGTPTITLCLSPILPVCRRIQFPALIARVGRSFSRNDDAAR